MVEEDGESLVPLQSSEKGRVDVNDRIHLGVGVLLAAAEFKAVDPNSPEAMFFCVQQLESDLKRRGVSKVSGCGSES